MTIENDKAAVRLARAILSDLAKYNAAKIAAGGDMRAVLAEEIAEGRALFHARVAAGLHSTFERELSAFDFTRSAAARGPALVGIVAFSVALVLAVAGWLLLVR